MIKKPKNSVQHISWFIEKVGRIEELYHGSNFRFERSLDTARLVWREIVDVVRTAPKGLDVVFRLRISINWHQALRLPDPIRWLGLFRWILPRNARDEIDVAVADLREDRKEMRTAGRSKWFILIVLSWHVIRIIGANVLDSAQRLLVRLSPFALLIRMFRK